MIYLMSELLNKVLASLKANRIRREALTEEERNAEDELQRQRWIEYMENGDHCGNCKHQNVSPRCNMWDSRDEPDHICNRCKSYDLFERRTK